MNMIIRLAPKPVLRGIARLEVARISYLRWWRSSKRDVFEWVGMIGIGVIAVCVIAAGLYFPIHIHQEKLVAISKQHVYKVGETAYCNHNADSTNNNQNSENFIPCTIVSRTDQLNYFVSYGTLQANICVENMRPKQ